MTERNSNNSLFYLVSFLAGGVLLASELLVAKLIGPYFGTSLYVWASVIGTTMIGLATGYYFASRASQRKNIERFLGALLLVTALYNAILPLAGGAIMNGLLSLDLRLGIIVTTLLINLPLYFLYGIYSPTIIEIVSHGKKDVGNHAGQIYGLSTMSGVLFLFATGIYFLPRWGIDLTFFMFAVALGVLGLVIHYKYRNA